MIFAVGLSAFLYTLIIYICFYVILPKQSTFGFRGNNITSVIIGLDPINQEITGLFQRKRS